VVGGPLGSVVGVKPPVVVVGAAVVGGAVVELPDATLVGVPTS
jgi:hypothetical protein